MPQDRHDACLQTLASIENHFTANRANIVQSTSEQDFTIAMLRVVGLRANENQIFIIAHDRPVGYSHRDAGMAYAFHTCAGMKAPNAKTMVWAANSHVARAPLVTGEKPMGSHLADLFGEEVRHVRAECVRDGSRFRDLWAEGAPARFDRGGA